MYLIGYPRAVTNPESLLTNARGAAGLGQEELAQRAGTSRPTLSSYEHGHRSPTLRTAQRILKSAGFELSITPIITFTEHSDGRGRTFVVPSNLPRLDLDAALALIVLPIHLHWSGPERSFLMRNRADRARVYEIVLREGGPSDVLTYIDGVLLVELWDELVIPRSVRAAWTPVIERALGAAA